MKCVPITGCVHFCIALLLTSAVTQAAAPINLESANAEWPRVHVKGDQEVAVYQPQVDEWLAYRAIRFKMAVRVTPSKEQEPAYGVMAVEATTQVDHDSRTVLIANPVIQYRFPNMSATEAANLEKVVRSVLPSRKSITVSLDRILAYVDKDGGVQREVEVNLDPPPIFYRDVPAVLVVFIGKPEFQAIKGTNLMAAVNTNWDILLDTTTSTYFLLLDGESWLSTKDPVQGPWTISDAAPSEIGKLPKDENWAEIRKAYPGKRLAKAPEVIVSTKPAELILTKGAPKYSPITTTGLMSVSNTENPLFYLSSERNHYFLVAGRWFRARDLSGPWTSATKDLPSDFVHIPEDHALAYVRASVPSTVEAEDAVLLASVPQTARVKKTGTTINVTYEGSPKFEQIPQTTVSYAVNSPYQVIKVNSRFYCCHQGVWFVSSSPSGPWAVCTSVPDEVYTIPATHPAHNVTYVYVYEEDDDEVEVGYTSGYTGEYVANGLLLFGAGMLIAAALEDDDDWWYCAHFHYSTHWYSYGCGAIYHPIYGGFYRGARWYGPYGGAGRIGYYNPLTGGWARGGYRYGPAGGAWATAGYNPYTDVFKARAGGSGIYGSWSRGYVQVGDEWIRGGTRDGARGEAGWVQTSGGSGAIAWDTRKGEGVVVKGPNDNVFVGHDGNIYRPGSNGDWQVNGANGWSNAGISGASQQPVSQAQTPSRQVRPAQQAQPARNQNVTAAPIGDLGVALNRDVAAREWGNRASSRQRAMSVPNTLNAGPRGGRAPGVGIGNGIQSNRAAGRAAGPGRR